MSRRRAAPVALDEFGLIARYFSRLGPERADVSLGVGDDAAVVIPPEGQAIVAAVDTLVEGVHFLADDPPASIGHRALAVNLSDLAAMGATPAWFLLSLTLTRPEEAWLAGFAQGLGALASRHGVALVGGDTTSGNLTVSVTAMGFAPQELALRRDGARAGDAIFVSGTVGDAAAGLALRQRRLAAPAADAALLESRYLYPQPRVALGLALRGLASACIDVSDGLGGDLAKLCRASGVGADLHSGAIPMSRAMRSVVPATQQRALGLAGGDDYELLFTVPPARRAGVESLAELVPVTCIGEIGRDSGVRCDGATLEGDAGHGFDHFRGA